MSYTIGVDLAVPGSDKTAVVPMPCLRCGTFSYACPNIPDALAHTRKHQGEEILPCWCPNLVAGVENERDA